MSQRCVFYFIFVQADYIILSLKDYRDDHNVTKIMLKSCKDSGGNIILYEDIFFVKAQY